MNCFHEGWAGGAYVPHRYHGIDNISFDKYEDAQEAALELADRCRTPEMLGLPVSTAHQAWW